MPSKNKSVSEKLTWEELHKMYEAEVPDWYCDFPFQSFGGWLEENCEVPELKREKVNEKDTTDSFI